MTVEIVLLAMIALFVGLRLYSVLGQRTGHEQQPVTRPEAAPGRRGPRRRAPTLGRQSAEPSGLAFEQGAAAGIRAIIAADPSFDVARFLEGAQAAYRMVLEAFWKGDREELAFLAGDEVRDAFEAAIAEREAAGHTLDNRLVAIERAAIEDARLDGHDRRDRRPLRRLRRRGHPRQGRQAGRRLAERRGRRPTTSGPSAATSAARDPNWLLVETDEAA